MENNAVALAALGILGGAVVTIGWIAKFALTKVSKDLQEHTKAALKQVESNHEVATSTKANTTATLSADKYLKERNGRDVTAAIRLAEVVKQNAEDLAKITEKSQIEIIKAINSIPSQIITTATITAKTLEQTSTDQHINTQTVDKQVVNGVK